MKVVLAHDRIRDIFHRDTHVFESSHGVVQIKINNIEGGEFCVGGGDNAVYQDLDGGEIRGRSTDIAGVLYAVSTYGKADSFGFLFVRFFLRHNT